MTTPASSTHESFFHKFGALFLKILPHIGEVASVAAQAGVHMSPQAQEAAALVQILASLHQAPPPAEPIPAPAPQPETPPTGNPNP